MMTSFLECALQKEAHGEENVEYKAFELFQNNLPHISRRAVCLLAQFRTLQRWGPMGGRLTTFSAPRLRLSLHAPGTPFSPRL